MKFILSLLVVIVFSLKCVSQINLQWAHTLAHGNWSHYSDATHDGAGNIVITGKTQLAFDIDPGPATTMLNAPNHIYLAKFSSNGTFSWGFEIPTYVPNTARQHIICDNSNNVIIAGLVGDSADFDPGPNQALLTGSWLGSGYIAKYDEDGTFQWVVQLTSNKWSTPCSITSDASNNIYIAGQFKDTLDLEPQNPNNPLLISTDVTSMYCCKYDPNGHLTWARQTSGMLNSYVLPGGIAVLQNGNVAVSFVPIGTVDIDPGASIVAVNGSEHTILYLDQNGDYTDADHLISNGNALNPGDLLVDHDGSLVITGTSSGQLDLDPGPGTCMINSVFYANVAFCTKILSDGSFGWGFALESQNDNEILSMAVDQENTLWIAGSVCSSTDFDPGTGFIGINPVANDEDGFVASYTAQGNLINVIELGHDTSSTDDACSAISVFGTQVICSGIAEGPIDFDPTTNSYVSGTYARYFYLAAFDFVSTVTVIPGVTAVQIFPNPATDQITLDGFHENEKIQISISNSIGQIVYSTAASGPTVCIPISSLASGAYVLTTTQSNAVRNEKIVIQR